ncbi:MAG: histidine kinase [Modestobacter sp.]|jgi:two-component system NarL family sensor kinase|nr:histidine kinase [Modestobacter sp.]
MATELAAPVAVTPVAASRPGRRTRRRWTWGSHPRRELATFLAVALLALVAVSGGTVLLSERVAKANALAEAERTAGRVAELAVAPVLAEALAGVPGRFEELDRIMANRLRDGSISSVVVWSGDGEVLYASDHDLIGRTFTPGSELLSALGGEAVADVDESPETFYEGVSSAPMVEVYTPMSVAGEPMVFEAYFDSGGIDRNAALLRWEIVPLAVGALVVLQLVQIPIATSLARRLRRQQDERAELMERTLHASERERRAVAADLHDGPVQDLAGVSYALGGLRMGVAEQHQATVDRLVTTVRHAVQSLRRVMVDIYPPDLSGPGLGTALHDLAEPLRSQGVVVSVDDGLAVPVSPDVTAVVYRTAKELLANVDHHADAGTVWIQLSETRLAGRPAVRLEVADDGCGFPETLPDRRCEGHLGLRLVVDRVADLGGVVEVGARPGGGALVTAVLPLPSAR